MSTLWPLLPGQMSWYIMNKGMSVPQSKSERFGIEKNLLPVPGIGRRSLGRPVTIITELLQLLDIMSESSNGISVLIK